MLDQKNRISELKEFSTFISWYVRDRILGFGVRFEKTKDIIVAFLIIKRGKYSQSFLNTSFFLLVSAGIIGGPLVVENNPFIGDYLANSQPSTVQVLSTDVEDMSLQTTFSDKPRDRVVNHEVKQGETLKSIADTFDISVDTIKWANNLKSDLIKPGEVLKVPPVDGIVHKVAPGDSIYSVAKKYKTNPQNIVNYIFNDYADPETFALNSGQTLIVPGGVIEAEKPRPVQHVAITAIAGTGGTGNFIWPTSGDISQYFVWYHRALDIANKSYPPVMASDTGTVSYANCVGWGYGCHVMINHGNGFQTLYAHLSRYDVSVGQQVSRGQTIGKVGTTGRSTGPHLHFEIRVNGAPQNPLGYLK